MGATSVVLDPNGEEPTWHGRQVSPLTGKSCFPQAHGACEEITHHKEERTLAQPVDAEDHPRAVIEVQLHDVIATGTRIEWEASHTQMTEQGEADHDKAPAFWPPAQTSNIDSPRLTARCGRSPTDCLDRVGVKNQESVERRLAKSIGD
ncbi:hypothetical protein D3C87_1416310 [compost metagenome]